MLASFEEVWNLQAIIKKLLNPEPSGHYPAGERLVNLWHQNASSRGSQGTNSKLCFHTGWASARNSGHGPDLKAREEKVK